MDMDVKLGYYGQSRSGYPAIGLLPPHFTLWPPRRRRAVLWVLANLVIFRTQQQRKLTLQDFIGFMKRSVEAVSVAQKGSECGKLPLCHRHENVTSLS